MELRIVAAQPNPPGKDVSRPGITTNAKLNEEWIEFEVLKDRNLSGDVLYHAVFSSTCAKTGTDEIVKFGLAPVTRGQLVRVHTGRGAMHLLGNTWHAYACRDWFAWNNQCGDVATLAFNGSVIDSAYYEHRPPEGELVRQTGTNKLIPKYRSASGW